jgi:creatine kinase/arginine kinase
LFASLGLRRTDSGFTLEQAIKSGRQHPDSAIGIYAGDAQSYKLFSAVFDPIIFEYHKVSKDTTHRSQLEAVHLPELDPLKKYIRSTRIRVARNLTDFSFPCHISLPQRQSLENRVRKALLQLTGDLKGRYVRLDRMDEPEARALKQDHLIFGRGDRFQEAAGINSDFPACRGIFVSADFHFLVWVNEEDHLRIISLEKTSNISSVFNRICRALQVLGQRLDFARDQRYGNLTSCPTNIGTAMRAGVHIRLEKLARKTDLLDRLVRSHHLQIRGTGGEKTAVEDAVFDISNSRRFGISEIEIIQNLYQGISAILQAEKNL